jgi:hypothetical protein
MFRGAWALGVITVLTAGALAGCGGDQSLAALKDPGAPGVEALRQALDGALVAHDARAQCELFAPMLLENYGGSVAACARSLGDDGLPYMNSPKAYVAGGHIEFRGNEAGYMIPFGQVPSEDPATFESESPLIAFMAIYTEGAWRVVKRE